MTEGNGEVRELSKGWCWAKLEEVVEILDSFRKPINAEERTKRIQGKEKNELFPYYGATGQVGHIDSYLLEGEYVLLGEDGAPFLDFSRNKAYLVNGKVWVNNHAHILSSLISSPYLCHFLNQVDYHDFVTGITRLKLNQASMKNIPIKIPPSNEQERIIEKIEELFSDLDQGIETLKTAQKQLKVYRQAVLKWAFEGKLTEQWRHANSQKSDLKTGEELLAQIKVERENRYQQQLAEWEEKVKEWEAIGKVGKKPTKPQSLKELTSLSEADLPDLTNDWSYEYLQNITHNISDVDHKMPKAQEDGIPYVSTKDFYGNNQINYKLAKKIKWDDYISLCKKVKPQYLDLLLSRYGTVGEVRKVLFQGDFQASYSIAIIKTIKEFPGLIDYLYWCFQSEIIQK